MNASKITVQTIASAETAKVWDYYTNPEHITKWNFASDDWQCPKATNDMRTGGKYATRMEAKDGSWGFDFEAIYDEIKDGEKFTYTMTDGRQATTTFKSLGDKTEITITFDAEKEHAEDVQKEGWQAILNSFKKYVENN